MPNYTSEQLKTFHRKSFYLTCPGNFERISILFLLMNLLFEMRGLFYPSEVTFIWLITVYSEWFRARRKLHSSHVWHNLSKSEHNVIMSWQRGHSVSRSIAKLFLFTSFDAIMSRLSLLISSCACFSIFLLHILRCIQTIVCNIEWNTGGWGGGHIFLRKTLEQQRLLP